MVESTGLVRFIIAGTDAEYYSWVREIQRETGLASDSAVPNFVSDSLPEDPQPGDAFLSGDVDSTTVGSESHSTPSTSESTTGPEGDEQKGRLQQRLGRFGKGALQAARQIGREVKRNPGKSFRPPDGESELPRGNGHWTCAKCTYVNTGGEQCDMCDQPLEVEHSAVFRQEETVVAGEGTTSAFGGLRRQLSQQLSMENDAGGELDEAGAPRRGVRGRLGTAAVKSVRLAKGLGENLRRRGPGGRPEGEGGQAGAPDSIKLRNVALSGPLEVPPRLFGDPGDETFDMPLKKLEGLWSVRVELPPTTERADSIGDEVYRVQVFRGSTEGNYLPVADIVRKLTDVLTLHTQLSESLSRLPLSSSSMQGEPGRSSVGEMNGSLTKKLGLTALDTVRLTGKLLGGILDSTTSSPCKAEQEHRGKSVHTSFVVQPPKA